MMKSRVKMNPRLRFYQCIEEIKDTIFEMARSKVLGFDGITLEILIHHIFGESKE